MQPGLGAGARSAALLVAALSTGACAERPRQTQGFQRLPAGSAAAAKASAGPRPSAQPGSARARLAPESGPLAAVPSALVDSAPPAAPPPDLADAGPFIVDELVDVAPAGPATATTTGVVLIDKQDTLRLARRGPLPKGDKPGSSPLHALEAERAAFAPYGRGPAVSNGHAYWVSRGRLVRRRIDGRGELEVLAKDARSGTRVAAAPRSGATPLVAYVTAPDADGTPHARLWTEGGPSVALTPDGAGTSSVALVAQRDGWMALTLDGRSGMTPLHARRVTREGAKLVLGPDLVAWVGSSAQSTTEIAALGRGDEVWAFVAIEIDVLHFGLAQIRIGRVPRLDVPAKFLNFANGINTSPVAGASLCGRAALVYARPSHGAPGAPQELVLAELGPDGLGGGQVVARSKAFADASFAAVDGGALLAYTADHRTWAASVRCR